MLIDTSNLVSKDSFRADIDRYIAAAKEGVGPVAITQGDEVIGFFIGRDEYESIFGVAVRDLLSSRSTGRTIRHNEALNRFEQVVRRRRKKASQRLGARNCVGWTRRSKT